jgi:hypothetical protein
MKQNKIGPNEWYQKFIECLEKEFTNVEYLSVHHFLVLSYMIQCDAYNDEYEEKAKTLLKLFNTGIKPEAIIKQNKELFEHNKNIKIIKPEIKRKIEFDTVNILDIRIDTAENYCQDVKRWAIEIENKL